MATIPTTRGSPSGDAPPVWPRRSVRFPEFPGDLVEHLAEARQLRSSTAAASQSAPLDITKLVQQTTGVITGVAELALIGAAFMLAIGHTLMGNHKPSRARSSLDAADEDRHGANSRDRSPECRPSRSPGESFINYSKRALALDQVEVMAALGHDRGARVTSPTGGPAAISSASRLCPN